MNSQVEHDLAVITKEWASQLAPVAIKMSDLQLNLVKQFTPITIKLSELQLDLSKQLAPIAINLSSFHSNLVQQLYPVSKKLIELNNELITNMVPIAINLQSVDFSPLYESMQKIFETYPAVYQAFKNVNITGIEADNLHEIELDQVIGSGSLPEQDGIFNEKHKKTLADLTVEEFSILLEKSLTTARKLSVPVAIYTIYSEYVIDAAKVLIEVIFAFTITFVTGQYNTEVKTAIINTVNDSMVVRDARKVITKYVKANPVEQIAFVRADGFLRQGASRNSPVVQGSKVSKNTVLTIIEKRSHWVKVEIENANLCGEIGWIEESKVIKFKRAK